MACQFKLPGLDSEVSVTRDAQATKFWGITPARAEGLGPLVLCPGPGARRVTASNGAQAAAVFTVMARTDSDHRTQRQSPWALPGDHNPRLSRRSR